MFSWKMYAAAVASLLNAVSIGFAATYSSTATENMKTSVSRYHPNKNEISWIGSILALGALLGGIVAGYLADRLGRKGALMLTSAPFVAGWLFISFANSLTLILIGRLLTGFCCGVICVVNPIYLVEISVPAIRGSFGAAFQLFISIGVFLVSLIGMFVNWNWLAYCGAVIATVAVIVMCWVPESPKWLIAQRKHTEAVSAIKFLQGNSVNADQECMALNEVLMKEQNYRLSCKDLFIPTIYKPAFLSLGLVVFQQFCGSNAILFYTVQIFGEAEKSLKPSEANLCVAAAMVFFTWISSYFLDSIGRKKFLFISGFMMFMTLIALGTFDYMSNTMTSLKAQYGWVPVLCVVVYIAAFSLGFGPIPWLMMAEMNSIRARSVVCGMGTAACWLFAFIITKSFDDLERILHDYSTFWVYSAFCLLSCIFTVIYLPETKGKTFEEIERLFSGEQHPERLPEPTFEIPSE